LASSWLRACLATESDPMLIPEKKADAKITPRRRARKSFHERRTLLVA
jgi:hypothetical protein